MKGRPFNSRLCVPLIAITAVLVVALAAWKLCYVKKPTASPAFSIQWHEQVYGLDEDEACRLILAPYTPQRMQFFAPRASQFPGATGQVVFYGGRGRARASILAVTGALGDLWAAVHWATMKEDRELEIATGLEDIRVDGDWSVRQEASIERRVAALESILSQVTRKDLVVESRLVLRDVLVVRGRWNFVPVELRPGVKTEWVYLYVTDGDLRAGARDNLSGSFEAFLHQVRGWSGRRVFDETEGPKPARFDWSDSLWREKPNENPEALDQFLLNLQKQTSLRFEKERRRVPGWYVHDRGSSEYHPSTQPRGRG